MAEQYCEVESGFGRFVGALDVADELKHDIHNFIMSNMGWKQSVEEGLAISQAWAEFEKEELVMSGLPQEQLSKPHGQGPIVFALNCNTMPKTPPQVFGPAYDLGSPTLRAIQDKQRSAMSLAELSLSGFFMELIHRRFWHDPKRSRQPYAHLGERLLALHSSLRKVLWALSTNPFALLLGRASFDWYITTMDPARLRKVPFSEDKIFGVTASLYIEYDEQHHIRRLSLPALHPSATYYNVSLQHHARISDASWNFVLSASGQEKVDEDFYVRRAAVIRSLAGQAQANLALPKIKSKIERASRPEAPLGYRYEQSGQYHEAGLLRKSWLHGYECAQAAESGIDVAEKGYADLPAQEYQLNGPLYQRDLEAQEILAEKEVCEDSDDESINEPDKTAIDRKYFWELDPETVEAEAKKVLLASDQIKTELIEFVVQSVKSEQEDLVRSSVSEWPEAIVGYLASKGLHYQDGERTTSPIRILSADMVLRGIATPAQLGWPNRTKKELVLVLMNRSSTGLQDSNKRGSQKHFKENGYLNLVAAREARAARDKKQADKAIALVAEYEKKHGTQTPAGVIKKRRAKDAADLAAGMSQEDIDKRNRAHVQQQAAHIRMKIRADLAGVRVNQCKDVELMLAEQSKIINTHLWRKLKMPNEKLSKGCYAEALKVLPAWLDARKKRLEEEKKQGKSVVGKRANLTKSIGEVAYKKLKKI